MPRYSKPLPWGIAAGLFLLTLAGGLTIYTLINRPEAPALPPYLLYNSTLRFEPESGLIELASLAPYRVDIRVNPGGEAINAAGVLVEYDPEMVMVSEIDTTRSFCGQDFFLEKTIDQQQGRVNISCIAPGAGFSGPDATVAALRIKPLREGTFSLRFNKETHILAADGLGTNVLRTTTNGSYRVARIGTALETAQNNHLAAPLVVSDSHPNSERWYPRTSVRLSWDKAAPGEVYRYALDRLPDTAPSEGRTVAGDTITLQIERDGIYYFHIARQKNNRLGPATHFKFMVDATPPHPPAIKASAAAVTANETVRLEFSSQDEASGLQSRYFYVKLDEGVFLPVASPLYVAFSEPGSHTVTVRAFDNAGNSRDASKIITIKLRPWLQRLKL
ncbi:hypothetical protein HYW17_05925 [Candidatus Uhrbacteria bacterium]|nr:hypothetical protein [Candidatus Uhrbacteria bacterium]